MYSYNIQPDFLIDVDAAGESGEENIEDWEEGDDGEGNKFYHNVKSGESRWEKPTFRNS